MLHSARKVHACFLSLRFVALQEEESKVADVRGVPSVSRVASRIKRRLQLSWLFITENRMERGIRPAVLGRLAAVFRAENCCSTPQLSYR
jgi:hypothetical protein